jgi:hypothetical protein
VERRCAQPTAGDDEESVAEEEEEESNGEWDTESDDEE